MLRQSLIKKMIGMLLVIFCINAQGETLHHTKLWSQAIIIGPLSVDHKIQYYIQPQLNLIDNKYKYQTALLYLGVGYQVERQLTLWLMNGLVNSRRLNGTYLHEDILRQQANWVFFQRDPIAFFSITRIEERKSSDESQWSLRIRQRLGLRAPFSAFPHYALVVYDEAFFDLNHPAWINTNSVLEQNWAYIGIRAILTKEVSLDVGYLNQYLLRQTDQMNNVLYLTLNVTTV